MPNIIFDGDRKIRFTDMDLSKQYDLNDLRFYLPKDKNVKVLYCLFKDYQKSHESIELSEIPYDSNTYTCYKSIIEKSFLLDSGDLTLTLFGICESSETIVSEDFSINVNVDNYNHATRLYWADKVSVSVADYYNKIVQLTNMNIEILSKIKDEYGGEVFDK
ncbi:hypothetical protein K413DRAFT_4769 [Clostridium sp. ASBs410]|nr:hypothetical protein K413DRAFT_4769 [Clostridium sp. ASBs410]